MRFHFLSHKFSRLLLPWAIVLILSATVALPASILRQSLLGGELALAVLALLDSVIPRGFPGKRFCSMARTFVNMNVAAALSMIVFFTPAEKLWRPTRVK